MYHELDYIKTYLNREKKRNYRYYIGEFIKQKQQIYRKSMITEATRIIELQANCVKLELKQMSISRHYEPDLLTD